MAYADFAFCGIYQTLTISVVLSHGGCVKIQPMLKDITFRPIADGYEFHFLLDGHSYEKVEVIRYSLNEPDADVLHDGCFLLSRLTEQYPEECTEWYIEKLSKKMPQFTEAKLMCVFEPIIQAHPHFDATLVPRLMRILKFEHGQTMEY